MYISTKQLTMKMFITFILLIGLLVYLSAMFIFLHFVYLIDYIKNELL